MIDPERLSPATLEAGTLVALIREQSAAEVAEITAQGRERAERITAAADAEAQSVRTAAQLEGVERGQRQAARVLAAAEAKSRRAALSEREALIADAISRARTQLEHFVELPGARQIVVELIQEGLGALPPGPVRVLASEEHRQLIDAAVASLAADGQTLRVETVPVPGGGVVLETEDGRRRFDNSFDARIGRRMRRLRRLVADALFGEEG